MTIFHVHTRRCGHAEDVPDEAYVRKAIALGADDIWFTDHAPFPGDPFGARMAYRELEAYIADLRALREAYRGRIGVHIGLETEYFPHFDAAGYYHELRALPGMEILLLGQHMAQTADDPPAYSFSLPPDVLDREEYRRLGEAVVQGIERGYFGAVAHPDRIFRRCGDWDARMQAMAERIIAAAIRAEIPLEHNLASMEQGHLYRPEFWALVPKDAPQIYGYDAHSIREMERRSIVLPLL